MTVEIQRTELRQNTDIDERAKKNINKKTSINAICGYTTASLAMAAATAPIKKTLSVFGKNLNTEQFMKVNNAVDKIAQQKELFGGKVINVLNLHPENTKQLTKLPNWVESMINPTLPISQGKNAAFYNLFVDSNGKMIKNAVLINRDKLPFASFHEIGHAFNYNNSSFWRSIGAMKPLFTALPLLISMIPVFTKEQKAEEGKELTMGQKFNNWIRNVSPILAFAFATPQLAEEGLASIRGCKMAKQLLDKAAYSKLVKTNIAAFSLYVAAAAGIALSAFVAKKVKDRSTEKQQQEYEQQQKMQLNAVS